jgi:hypothetical protein
MLKMTKNPRGPRAGNPKVALSWMLVVVFLAGQLTQYAARAQAQARPVVKLENGRMLELLLSTAVDSETSKVGDALKFQLAEPVTSGGYEVLPAGWIVDGQVSKVRSAAKSDCNGGIVRWKLSTATAPDGTKITLRLVGMPPYGLQDPTRKRAEKRGQKAGKIAKDVAIAPAMAVALALFLPEGPAMAAGEKGEPCSPYHGFPEHFGVGTVQYAALSKAVKVEVRPAAN